MEKEKGKYVKRSTFQKVVEENKKLLNDIKILTSGSLAKRALLTAYWKDKFKEKEEIHNFIKDLITQNIRPNE